MSKVPPRHPKSTSTFESYFPFKSLQQRYNLFRDAQRTCETFRMSQAATLSRCAMKRHFRDWQRLRTHSEQLLTRCETIIVHPSSPLFQAQWRMRLCLAVKEDLLLHEVHLRRGRADFWVNRARSLRQAASMFSKGYQATAVVRAFALRLIR